MTASSLWTRNFTLAVLANSAAFFGVQILYPTLPLFLVELGGTAKEIGIVMGIFTLSAVCSRPFAVYGAGRWGRFQMIILGVLLSGLSVASYYWGGSVIGIAIPRIIHGFGFGILTTIYASVVSDMLPKSRRGEGLGYFGLGSSLTMTVAPFLGILLIEETGFFSMFMLAIVTQIFAFLMIFSLSRAVWDPPKKEKVPEQEKAEISSKKGWIPQSLLLPSFLTVLFGGAMGSVSSYVSVYAKIEGISGVGLYFVISSISVCLVRLVSGGIFDRKGPYWVLIPGGIFFIIGFALLYWGTGGIEFLGSAIFYGIGMGSLFPALQAWTINRSSAEKRAGANAIFYNCLDIGVGAGIIFLGYFAGEVGYRQMYGLGSGIVALFLITAIVSLLSHKKGHREH